MILRWYRRRKRLVLVDRLPGYTIRQYKDPETGLCYVGGSRWDLFMTESVRRRIGSDEP